MPSEKINEFAKTLIQQVRDPALRSCDMDCRPECQSIGAQRWRRLGVSESNQLAMTLIADCVDATMFWLLDAIDQGTLKLQFVRGDGSIVDLTSDGLGELGGWYVGSDGFCSKYSGERLSEFVQEENDDEDV